MTRRTAFLIGLLLELVAIFGLFVPYVILTTTGTKIALRTIPVDPRSLTRGDYVTLDYVVAQGYTETTWVPDIFITLEKKGDFYERVSFSETKPVLAEGQVCLHGIPEYNRVALPDIAQYFVEEDFGKELESARNSRRLIVDAAVNEHCNAVIVGVRLGEEAPLEEEVVPATIPVPTTKEVPSSEATNAVQ